MKSIWPITTEPPNEMHLHFQPFRETEEEGGSDVWCISAREIHQHFLCNISERDTPTLSVRHFCKRDTPTLSVQHFLERYTNTYCAPFLREIHQHLLCTISERDTPTPSVHHFWERYTNPSCARRRLVTATTGFIIGSGIHEVEGILMVQPVKDEPALLTFWLFT